MEKISLRMFAFGIFICLAVWAGAAQLLQIPVVPSPELVLIRLAQKFPDTIAVHAGYSLMRIMVGLFAAVVAGYPIGVLMGYFPRVNRLLAPILYLSYPIPKIALLPVVMLLFGVGETSKLLLVFLIIVFQIVVAVRDAVAAIPSETYFPLRVLGASFTQLVRHIIQPSKLQKFITALRDLRAVFHGDIRYAVRHRLLYHGRMAACELPRYVRRYRRPEHDGASVLCPARFCRAAAVRVESAVKTERAAVLDVQPLFSIYSQRINTNPSALFQIMLPSLSLAIEMFSKWTR